MEQKVQNTVVVKSRVDQLCMLDHKDFIDEVEKMVDEGMPIYPEIQKEMLESLITSRVFSFVTKMNDKGLWIHSDLLIFWMRFADRNVPQSSTRKKDEPELSPCVALLVDYRKKHQAEPWSRSFVSEAVKQPHFVELFNNLKLKLSEADEVVLANRPDIIEILSKINQEISFTEKAMMILADDYDKFLAYVRNRKETHIAKYVIPAAFIKISSRLADEPLQNLLKEISNDQACIKPVKGELLQRHSYEIANFVVKSRLQLSGEDIQEIMLTPQADELLAEYLDNGNYVNKELRVQVFDALDSSSEHYAKNVTTLLCSTDPMDISRDLVLRVAALPDKVFNKIAWKTYSIVNNKQLWIYFLQTTRATAAMQKYCEALEDRRLREGGYSAIPNEVAEVALTNPNVIEILAGWKAYGWGFNLEVCISMEKSPYVKEIKDTFGNLDNFKV